MEVTLQVGEKKTDINPLTQELLSVTRITFDFHSRSVGQKILNIFIYVHPL